MFCLSTAILSNSILGAGMWFWVIIASGIFVGISPYFLMLNELGAVVAGLLSVVSVAAVLFGLVAATIGGSFRLDDSEGLLLFLFLLIAISGFSVIAATVRHRRIANR